MQISNKKRKYIRRNADRKTPEELAKELRLSVRQVKAVLKKNGVFNAAPGEQTTFSVCFGILTAIIFLTPLAIFNGLYEYSMQPKLIIIQMGSLILLFSWLITGLYKQETFVLVKSNLSLPLICFLVWALFSLFWSTNRYNGLVLWVHWSTCGLVYFLCLQILTSANRIKVLFYTLSIAAVIVSIIGLLQYFFEIDWFLQLAKPASTFGNKNMAAQFIGLCFPVVIMFFISAKKSRNMWTAALILSLVTVYLFHTRTKAVWVAIMAQVFILVLFFLYNRFALKGKVGLWNLQKTIAGISTAVVVLLLINLGPSGWKWQIGEASQQFEKMVTPLKGRPGELSGNISPEMKETTQDYATSSAGARLVIWRNTIDLIKTHPIRGVGLNNFGVEYPRIAIDSKRDTLLKLFHGPRHAHNDYLQIISELGLPAILLIIWASFLILKSTVVLLKPNTPQENTIIGTICLAGIAGLAVNACASFPMYRAVPPLLLAVYSAILYRMTRVIEPEGTPSAKLPSMTKLPKKLVRVSVVLSFLILCFWSVVQIRWLIADRYSKHRLLAMAQKNWPAVIYWGKKVQSTNPFRADMKHAMGRAYFETGKFQEAEEYFIAYQKVYPHTTHNLFFLAKNYELLQDYQKAETTIKHLMSILPNHADSHNILGRIYGRRNKHEESIREFRMATNLAPGVSDFHFNLGIELFKGKRYEEAVVSFNEAVKLNDKSVLAHKNLGLILFHNLNRKKEGIFHLKKTLELNPELEGSERIRNTIAVYEKSLKTAQPEGKNEASEK
jgi:tetratricopeptide (TPR) repeat protein